MVIFWHRLWLAVCSSVTRIVQQLGFLLKKVEGAFSHFGLRPEHPHTGILNGGTGMKVALLWCLGENVWCTRVHVYCIYVIVGSLKCRLTPLTHCRFEKIKNTEHVRAFHNQNILVNLPAACPC